MELNEEQQRAYDWSKKQNYRSVAATYAKLLVGVIDQLEAENEKMRVLILACPKCARTVRGLFHKATEKALGGE